MNKKLLTAVLVSAIAGVLITWALLARTRQPRSLGTAPAQPVSPAYERVVRAALPHDLSPRDSVACIGAYNDKGELYDLGCNVSLEHDPMVGIYKAVFSENPDKDLHKLGLFDNVAGSAWKCHFATNEVKLICERPKSK